VLEKAHVEREAALGRLELAMATMEGIVYEWDPGAQTGWRSNGLHKLLGLAEEDAPMDSRWWTERIHPADRPSHDAAFSRLLRDPQKNAIEMEYRARHKDGSYRILWNRSQAERDPKGKVRLVRGTILDITERRRADDQYRVIMELAPQFIWAADASGAITYSNNALLDYMGVDQAETLGALWIDRLHPDDRDRALLTWQRAVAAGTPYEIEFRLRGKTGDYGCFLNRAVPIRDPGGGPIERWIGVSVDISDRKRAEDEQRRTSALLHSIMTSSTDTIFVKDRAGRMVYCNPSLLTLLSATEADTYGKNDVEFLGPGNGGEEILLTDERIMSTGRGEVVEEPVTWRDGTRRIYLSRKEPHRDGSGKVIGLIGIGRDITDRKEVEARLAFERHQLETIFQQSPAAMVLFRGPDFVFEKVNPQYQAFFPDRELLGRPFLAAIPELADQPFKDMLTEVFETGRTLSGREVLARLARRRGGPLEDRYYDFVYMQLNDADGRPYGVYVHATDVTSRVLDQRSLEHTRDRIEATVRDLEQERELRDRFVAMLTHDLRNPLMAIQLSAQRIRRKASEPQVVQQMVGKIDANIDRTEQMIRDLLDASRIRAGEKLPLEIEACELNQIAKDTIEGLGALHEDRFVLRPGPPILGHFCKKSLRRALENLCNNAIKYGADHRPVTLSLFLHEGEEKARIEVHNEGRAIPAEEKPRLFESFKRSASAQLGRQKGWGLGLTLVKGIAEAHGGSVGVESREETGTTFFVVLPLDARSSRS
jgi:PAS domain S-box-containing protein